MKTSKSTQLLLGFAIVLVAGWSRPAAAQERPTAVLEFSPGSLVFPDDGIVTEGLAGGAARIYLSPRISIGPEFAHVSGSNHSHLMLTGNVTMDILEPVNGRQRMVTPFFVIGGGMFQTRERFPNNATFTSREGAFTAGGGVRALVANRVIVGAEARVGWELHLRFNGLVGVRLGR